MANWDRRLTDNVDGDLFVDDSCIDCATCRWMAPSIFDHAEAGMSKVHTQPTDEASRKLALQALISCPTSSIGSLSKAGIDSALSSFPRPITNQVFHCGYHSESSFGAASWLIQRPEGNVLIDSPRFNAPLVKRLEVLGGIKTMFLTHRDDVADHQAFADHFGCTRIIHEDDVTTETRDIENILTGNSPHRLAKDLLVLPVPGHTKGSTVLIFNETVLFSGDHVAWSNDMQQIIAFRRACWHDWNELKRSMQRLAKYDFEWILPGHGWPCHFQGPRMKEEMKRCLDWMETV